MFPNPYHLTGLWCSRVRTLESPYPPMISSRVHSVPCYCRTRQSAPVVYHSSWKRTQLDRHEDLSSCGSTTRRSPIPSVLEEHCPQYPLAQRRTSGSSEQQHILDSRFFQLHAQAGTIMLSVPCGSSESAFDKYLLLSQNTEVEIFHFQSSCQTPGPDIQLTCHFSADSTSPQYFTV